MTAAEFHAGDRVRVLTGTNGGREGAVTYVYRSMSGPVVEVALTVPVLLTQPDGPTRNVVLPYAPAELAHAQGGDQ